MSKPPSSRDASPKRPPQQGAKPADSRTGDRIAKVLARAGVASRRVAETMIAEGRVSVNGKLIDSPALNVTPRDRISVDGTPIGQPEPTRVWMYNKPLGLVTSERDEKGRDTVFDALPDDMPRVMSIGRLDLNSEGLLLLTNDGDLKRRLELPSTGWVRKYRVRVNGTPDEAKLAPLRQGITIDGERFLPMMVTLDRQQGANAWLTVGIREGKNREIRRAMESVGLTVNRLIRISYGPFQLGTLPQGQVEELRPRALRDQLGLSAEQVGTGRESRIAARPGGAAGSKPGPSGSGAKSASGAKSPGKSSARPPRAAADGDDKPAGRKSWGRRSHGGGAAKSQDKPRSWGAKSAKSTAQPRPNKPR